MHTEWELVKSDCSLWCRMPLHPQVLEAWAGILQQTSLYIQYGFSYITFNHFLMKWLDLQFTWRCFFSILEWFQYCADVAKCFHTAVWRAFSSPVMPWAESMSLVRKNDIILRSFSQENCNTVPICEFSRVKLLWSPPCVCPGWWYQTPFIINVSEGWFVLETASPGTFWAYCLHSTVEKGALPKWPCIPLFFSLVGFLFRPSLLLSLEDKPTKTNKDIKSVKKKNIGIINEELCSALFSSLLV